MTNRLNSSNPVFHALSSHLLPARFRMARQFRTLSSPSLHCSSLGRAFARAWPSAAAAAAVVAVERECMVEKLLGKPRFNTYASQEWDGGRKRESGGEIPSEKQEENQISRWPKGEKMEISIDGQYWPA